jgi:GTP-binding protein
VTLDPTTDDAYIEPGRKLFAQPCEFIWGAAGTDGLPPLGAPEIAFVGRSNVGKSSLLNALTNRKTLARVSHTPGRTQQLNFFALGDKLRLVDMPGYGFAAVGKSKVAAWTEGIRAYLRGRPTLLRVYLLVDGRHGLKANDKETMEDLDRAAVSYQIILTKCDEVKAAEREGRVAATLAALERHPAAHPNVIFTSSKAGDGVECLRAAVARLLSERSSAASAKMPSPSH